MKITKTYRVAVMTIMAILVLLVSTPNKGNSKKIKKTATLFLLFSMMIIMIGAVEASQWCYQESANVSTSCGGLDTGNYSYGGSWSIAFPVNNNYDENWNTYSLPDTSSRVYFIVNYSKPLGSISSILEYRIYGLVPKANITISDICFQQSVISLQVNLSDFIGNVYISCWNGSNYDNIVSTPADAWRFWEEAMWWNISTTTINSFSWISGTNKTLTNISYEFNVSDANLSGYIYSNNMSGSWVNSSWYNISGLEYVSNFSFYLSNVTNRKNVCFQLWVNNSNNYWNGSDIKCIDARAPILLRNCYQESANVTNQTGVDGVCGLDYSGTYGFSQYISQDNTIDGNWSTGTGTTGGSVDINYSIPKYAIGSTWMFTGGYSVSTTNNTIPLSCLGSTTLMLKYSSGGCSGESYLYCYNTTAWQLLRTNTGFTCPPGRYCTFDCKNTYMYEDAMFWNITFFNSFNWISGTNKTLTNVSYSFNLTDTEYNLSGYIIGTNMSTGWINSSWYNISGMNYTTNFSFNLSNATYTYNKNTCLQIYVNDTDGTWDNSDVICLNVANTIPVITDLSFIAGTNQTITNITINFTCSDADAPCSSWVLSSNMSGVWQNSSFYTTFNATYSFNLSNASYNKNICFQGFANDTANAFENTSIACVDVANTIPVIDSFNWTSGTNQSKRNITYIFSAYDDSFTQWMYSNNMSGSWVNSSWYNFTGTYNSSTFSFNLSNATRGKYFCFNIYVNDTAGAVQNTTNNCLTVLNVAPSIPTNLLQENGYSSPTVNMTFNFTSTDDDGDNVTYYLFVNTTAPITQHYNGTDRNYSTNFTEGTYYWTVFASDGLVNGSNSTIRNFIIALSVPSINLVGNDTQYFNSSNVSLSFNAYDVDSLTNCTLYTNISGTYKQNTTNNSIAVSVNTIFNLSNIDDGEYVWNVFCTDAGAGLNTSFALNNKTFIVDTVNPVINVVDPSGTKYSRSITSIYTITEKNAYNCLYNVFRGATAEVGNTSIACNSTSTAFTVSSDADYTFSMYAIDYSGHQSSDILTFSVIPSAAPQSGASAASLEALEIKNICDITSNIKDLEFNEGEMIKTFRLYNNENFSIVPEYNVDTHYFNVKASTGVIDSKEYTDITVLRNTETNGTVEKQLTIDFETCQALTVPVTYYGAGKVTAGDFFGNVERYFTETIFSKFSIFGTSISYLIILLVTIMICIGVVSIFTATTAQRVIAFIFLLIFLNIVFVNTLTKVEDVNIPIQDTLVMKFLNYHVSYAGQQYNLLSFEILNVAGISIKLWIIGILTIALMLGIFLFIKNLSSLMKIVCILSVFIVPYLVMYLVFIIIKMFNG